MKLKKPITGEPKWDWIINIRLPLDLRKIKFGAPHVGKGFMKRMLKRLKIEL